MIFENIYFHNVEEMETCAQGGYYMWRLPRYIREKANEGIGATSKYTTGVELRFKMISEHVTLILRTEEKLNAQVVYIYYGSIQGGWRNSARTLSTENTRLIIEKTDNLESLKRISKEQHLCFNPEVVRVLLPEGVSVFVGIEGEIERPEKKDMPDLTYLAYGSSITHGSLALAQPYYYPFRVSQKFRCDYINLGFSGSAQMEKCIAEYITTRQEWNFATVEMGINMLDFPIDKIKERINIFVQLLANDRRPIFATSIFGINEDKEKLKHAEEIREYIREVTKDKIYFIDGKELLDNPAFITQDLVHPSIEGIENIVELWTRYIQEHITKWPNLLGNMDTEDEFKEKSYGKI